MLLNMEITNNNVHNVLIGRITAINDWQLMGRYVVGVGVCQIGTWLWHMLRPHTHMVQGWSQTIYNSSNFAGVFKRHCFGPGGAKI